VLALLLTSIALLRLDLFVTARELALGIALLIAAAGHALDLGTIGGVRTSIAYGAVIAFAAATALLVVLFVGAPLPPRGSLRVVGAPAGLAAVYVLLVVLSYVDLLPDRIEWYGARHGSWLAISGALIGLHLVEHWGWRRGSYPWLLVLLPLELCATAVLYLLEDRSAVTWGGGIVVVLTLLLAWLGRVEASRGLEHFELPAILRIDRI
jgi:hypothetical protein